nr:hypothetical protein [Tanacetum cinerariifolium]
MMIQSMFTFINSCISVTIIKGGLDLVNPVIRLTMLNLGLASTKCVLFQSPRESVGSNDMVQNFHLEEAKKNAQIQKDKALNTKPSMRQSARLPNTANGSKPKPRNSDQQPRNFPPSMSSRVSNRVVNIAEPPRKSKPFLNSKDLACLTCKKCIYTANHDTCILKHLSEFYGDDLIPYNLLTHDDSEVIRGYYTLSWKLCQGDSFKLNLPDHRVMDDRLEEINQHSYRISDKVEDLITVVSGMSEEYDQFYGEFRVMRIDQDMFSLRARISKIIRAHLIGRITRLFRLMSTAALRLVTRGQETILYDVVKMGELGIVRFNGLRHAEIVDEILDNNDEEAEAAEKRKAQKDNEGSPRRCPNMSFTNRLRVMDDRLEEINQHSYRIGDKVEDLTTVVSGMSEEYD